MFRSAREWPRSRTLRIRQRPAQSRACEITSVNLRLSAGPKSQTDKGSPAAGGHYLVLEFHGRADIEVVRNFVEVKYARNGGGTPDDLLQRADLSPKPFL